MMQVYVDLLYLTGQRGNDIRLLRWSQVDEASGVIHFQPSKTAKSSGAKVEVPITPPIAEVLERAKTMARAKARISPYVIHNLEGGTYTHHGVGTAWERARNRAGITDATLKDLRAKHATDAKRAGYTETEIQDALAHEDTGTTRIYLKQRMARVSKVELSLPHEIKES
jgi:integrase